MIAFYLKNLRMRLRCNSGRPSFSDIHALGNDRLCSFCAVARHIIEELKDLHKKCGMGTGTCVLLPFSNSTEAHAVCTFFSHLLDDTRESACVVEDMDTATEVAALPDTPMTPCDVPAPALLPVEAALKAKEDSRDHIDRDVHDASFAVTSEKNARVGTLTADAVNGDSDGTFTHDPIPLTDDHRDSGYMSGANGIFDDIWSPATKLKRRLEDTKDLIVCPGVYDGFSARIALSVGFEAMYMVGFSYFSSLGQSKGRLGLTAS